MLFLYGIIFAIIGVAAASSDSFGGEYQSVAEGQRPFYVASVDQLLFGLVAVVAANVMLMIYAMRTGSIAMLAGWI